MELGRIASRIWAGSQLRPAFAFALIFLADASSGFAQVRKPLGSSEPITAAELEHAQAGHLSFYLVVLLLLITAGLALVCLMAIGRLRRSLAFQADFTNEQFANFRSHLAAPDEKSEEPDSEGLDALIEKANRRFEKRLRQSVFSPLSRKLDQLQDTLEKGQVPPTLVEARADLAAALPAAFWPNSFSKSPEAKAKRESLGAFLADPDCPDEIVTLAVALLEIRRLESASHLDLEDWARRIQSFSEAAYQASRKTAERLAWDDASFDAGSYLFDEDGFWSRETSRLIGAKGLALQTRSILPGDPFDSDVMQVAASDSGQGKVVSQPCSWIIFKTEDERSTLLARGQVETK